RRVRVPRAERRREFDEHLRAASRAAELEMRERGGGEIRGAVGAQVLLGDAAEERADEIRRERAPRVRQGAGGLDDYLLDERETGGGNLAEHSGVLGKGARLYRRVRADQSACAGPSPMER